MLNQEKHNLKRKTQQTLPGSVAVLKWAACVPSVGPWSLVPKGAEQNLLKNHFVLTYVGFDKELMQCLYVA